MPTPEYEDYLASSAWHQIRARRLRFDRWRCRNCHVTEGLQVHHWYYSRDGESLLGREHLEDLVTLCDHCHLALTQRRQQVFGTSIKAMDSWRAVVIVAILLAALWVWMVGG